MNWEQEEKAINLRNKLAKTHKIYAMSFTDFDRQIVTENNGTEEIVPVKEITYEAKPNETNNTTEIIIKEYTEKLGWEYISTYKQAWVNGLILHHIYFKL